MVRDSAGITIVENMSPGAWTEAEAWRVADRPTVAIGALDAEPEYQLHGVTGAVRLTDGRIVIANGGTNELRAYSPDGRHQWTAGGTGGGPGEFEGMRRVERVRGDTLLVYDGRHRRVSFFTADGDFVRSFQPEWPPDAILTVVAALDDGALVGRTVRRVENDPDTAIRDTLIYHLISPDGSLGAEIGRFLDGEEMRRVQRQGNMVSISTRSVPFGRSTFAAAGGGGSDGRIVIGTSDRWAVGVYDGDGALARVIRRPDRPPREMTDAIYERYIEYRIATIDEAMVSGQPPSPGQIREDLRSLPRVPSLPTYGGLVDDDAGNLWVRVHELPWETDADVDWTVYDPDGRLLGTVALPAGLRVTDLAGDAVVGIVRDDLDVEHVHVYTLHETGG